MLTRFYPFSFLATCTLLMWFSYRRPSSESEVRQYIYVAISVIGFTVTDLFYIAAIVNYALQCQLITFLINMTVERIHRNCWKVDHAIKVYNVLNHATHCAHHSVQNNNDYDTFIMHVIW